jgi:uncharacterized membrane protein YhaH (DUF805 family)
MIDTYLQPWKKYFDFRGRAARSEFWTFTLINVAIEIILAVLSQSIGVLGPVEQLFALAILVPSIAVGIRRLHDLDRTGWWLLIELTGIGLIVLLVWYCMAGTPGSNRFGPPAEARVALSAG